MIRQVAVPHGTVEVCDEGPASAECIVVLHGFTGSKESWSGVRARLRERWRIIAIDLPGHGGTRVGPGSFPMSGASAAVLAALDALGVGEFSLVGYSMGGRLALAMALEAGSRVRRLVLESASAGLADTAERRRRLDSDEALARRIEQNGIEAFVDEWERLPLFASLGDLEPRARETLRRQRLGGDPAGLAASLRSMGSGAQPWLGGRLGELRMAVLVIAGERDAKFASIARDLVAAIPDARLAGIEGAGHMPHLEKEAAFTDRVADFLLSPTSPPWGEVGRRPGEGEASQHSAVTPPHLAPLPNGERGIR